MYNGNVYFGGGGVSTNIIFKKVAQRKNSLMQKGRNNMINGELVVDNFAGGGGASLNRKNCMDARDFQMITS